MRMIAILLVCLAGAPVPAAEASGALATRWPILLSHSWSNRADNSFLGDREVAPGHFAPYGVKQALEAEGAVVYQPDKLPYASHQTRGRLLYRKCEGATLAALLCEEGARETVDGVHRATRTYCADPALRARSGFASEARCRRELRFNIICHSQGCPDSRYMMVAVTQAYSGRPMYRHVASWTSLAGANKGTALADWALGLSAACLFPECRFAILGMVLGIDGMLQSGTFAPEEATASLVALSRKYMLQTTDMNCHPEWGQDCPPSFNERYPLPRDPAHPIRYVTYSLRIDDIDHHCYRKLKPFWRVISEAEGANDGYISVESQRFTSYGEGGQGGATGVIARDLEGHSADPARPHPGLDHMAVSASAVPGLPGVSCGGEDNSAFSFSREAVFRDIVAELASLGY